MIFQIWQHADGTCRSLTSKTSDASIEFDRQFARMQGTENVLMDEFEVTIPDNLSVSEAMRRSAEWHVAKNRAAAFWAGYDARGVEPVLEQIEVHQGMFDSSDRYTHEAAALDRKAAQAIQPLFDEAMRAGHSAREVSHIIMLASLDCEMMAVMDKEFHRAKGGADDLSAAVGGAPVTPPDL